jgi:imidazolonepropionase-like amidohydrolase
VASAETIVVTADRMVDVLAGRIVEEPVVVITNGRIASVVGRGGARPVIPEGARRIDLPGKTILPVSSTCTSTSAAAPFMGIRYASIHRPVRDGAGRRQCARHAQAGFTTIRNVGSSDYADVAYKQAIEEGRISGPRIVPGAYSLGATGGHCDSNFLPPSLAPKDPGVGDGAQALRALVRQQRKFGAEVIKVCATGGVFSRNTEPGQQQLSEEELRAIADEAHQWGLKAAAHAHGAAGIKAAIRAGIDTIEHASLVDDEGIRLAVERRQPVWFSMDIFNTDYTQAEGAKNGILEDNLRKDREVAQIQRDNFRRPTARA